MRRARATGGISDPCSRMENSTIVSTMWKISLLVEAGSTVTMMANTMDAAPRMPAHDTSNRCRTLHRNGDRMANTAAGRATKVRNSAISSAVGAMAGRLEGYASSPRVKNSSICIIPVAPSKKLTSTPLLGIFALPSRMPAR